MPPISSNGQPRVFVTGMGQVSPMGTDYASHVSALRAGSTHFSEVDFFDTSRLRVHTAGIAALADDLRKYALSQREFTRTDRGTRLLIHATGSALESAGLTEVASNTPFVIGTSAAAMPIGESYYKAATTPPLSRRGQFTRVENYQPQRSCATVQRAVGIRAQTQIISNACASGANAIGHAYQLIRSGQRQTALCGGYDALCEMVYAGFDSLQALSVSGIPRPFDAHRDGLALGEAAAMFVLESENAMLARGATPIAEVCGYGMATDLHHLTQPHPEGVAAISSMSEACREGGVNPEQVQYINSHGTGTPLNDVAEANAICHWAGEHAKDIMVSSTKSAMGHSLGGAGAIESAICLMALQENLAPASLNVREVDPACGFDLVQEPRDVQLDTVLTNSFGFGGCNASLIFRKATS